MKKIMFNDKYVLTQAVLDGRKTMMRRIIPNRTGIRYSPFVRSGIEDNHGYELKPKYKIGEVVAIAQSYKTINEFYKIAYKRHNSFHGQIVTKYDIPFKEIVKWFELRESLKDTAGWTNKMFVKADLMISHIRITDVKIERLQDISDEDCLREGVELNTRQYEYDGTKRYCVRGLGHWRAIGCDNFNTPREAFAALIDKFSGKGTWESNPWVFAYEFELID